MNRPLVASLALAAVLVATLITNVAANVVSPSSDFSNLNPRRISFRTGGLITGVLGVVCMPWRWLSDANAYVFGWLVGYSSLLGPIAGIMIADYFLLRERHLDVDALYARGGPYEYTRGINWRAIGAFAVGAGTAVFGLWAPSLRWLYDYAWFVGVLISGFLYALPMRGRAAGRGAR